MNSTSDFAVQCKSLVKRFLTGETEVMALRGADLEVKKGELLLLAGPSGCGKTTLLSVVSGILHNDEGECIVFGQNVTRMEEKELSLFRAKQIGFVFQQFNLIPSLTAAENVAIPLMINGLDRQIAIQKAGDILDRMGLEDKKNVLPVQLSGGQQQRVAIARSIVHNPKLVVCDEPTSALDSTNGKKIMELLKSLVQGTDNAMIVVTHDIRIFEFGDRIADMEDGRILRIAPYKRGSRDH